MKIVVADGYALTSGDLSWDGIEQLGELTVYDRTLPAELIERCREADIIVSNKTPVGKEAIQNLPKLKMITMLATGYNVIDVNAAKEKGIVVSNVPAYGTDSVAQHAFSLILALTNQVHVHASSVEKGEWQRSLDFGYALTPLTELAGKTLGIVGMGNIGQQTAKIGEAFGMKILYHSRHEKKVSGKYATLEQVFSQSDFISLHCPLTDENFGFVNASLIRLMKPSGCIINTARGQLINEQDLANALNNGIIAGAGLDVLSKEPPGENPLIGAKNCVITPHNAWMTREARQRIMEETEKNISCFIKGTPVNVVN